MARAVNFVWNYCNETGFHSIRNYSRWLSYQDFQKATKVSKDLNLNSATIQMVCREYCTRIKQFKKRKLRFRGRKSLGWIPFRYDSISFKDQKIKYNRRIYKVFQPERLPEKDFQSGEFCQDSRGRWYICIPVIKDLEKSNAQNEVGIDLGLKDVAILSSGEKVTNNRYYRMMERRLKKAQRYKKKKLVKSLHAKIKNKRLDHLHKASTQIAKDNKLIVVGKLEAKKLAKTKMAKSINDAGTSTFRTMLKYKASALGHRYIEVSEYLTTQTCSCCELVPASAPRGVKGLGVREWVCSECGSVHDRDVNAAMNILRIGHNTLESEGI